MHTRHLLALLCVPALACAPGSGSKLGAQGEICYQDDDCRPSLLCERNLCVSSDGDDNSGNNGGSNNGGNNAGNNGFNNSFNNAGLNNVVTSPTCETTCAHLDACRLTDPDSCVAECRDSLDNLPDRLAQDVLACIEDQSCDELQAGGAEGCVEGSIPDDPDPGNNLDPIELEKRYAFCDEFSRNSVGACPEVYEYVVNVCFDRAEQYDEQRFYELQNCFNDVCEAVYDCTKEWGEP
jgi:hypothetical protein